MRSALLAGVALTAFAQTIGSRYSSAKSINTTNVSKLLGGGKDDLREGIRIRQSGQYQVTSPPAIVNNVLVVGSSIGDNRVTDIERGTVRAYVMSANMALGLVFVPTGSAAPDFYGGERRGDNTHANSVTALRANTGEVAWNFQVVHHDLWDMTSHRSRS